MAPERVTRIDCSLVISMLRQIWDMVELMQGPDLGSPANNWVNYACLFKAQLEVSGFVPLSSADFLSLTNHVVEAMSRASILDVSVDSLE